MKLQCRVFKFWERNHTIHEYEYELIGIQTIVVKLPCNKIYANRTRNGIIKCHKSMKMIIVADWMKMIQCWACASDRMFHWNLTLNLNILIYFKTDSLSIQLSCAKIPYAVHMGWHSLLLQLCSTLFTRPENGRN